MAEMRISLMKEKLTKITVAPKRNEDLENKSQMSFIKKYKTLKLVLKIGSMTMIKSNITTS